MFFLFAHCIFPPVFQPFDSIPSPAIFTPETTEEQCPSTSESSDKKIQNSLETPIDYQTTRRSLFPETARFRKKIKKTEKKYYFPLDKSTKIQYYVLRVKIIKNDKRKGCKNETAEEKHFLFGIKYETHKFHADRAPCCNRNHCNSCRDAAPRSE